MAPDPDITRGEFDMLRQQVASAATRLESLDDHGTRGVGIIQSQLTDVVKDLGELKTEFTAQILVLKNDVDTRFKFHMDQHDRERRERVSGRRWVITTAVTTGILLVAVLSLLIPIFMKVHA